LHHRLSRREPAVGGNIDVEITVAVIKALVLGTGKAADGTVRVNAELILNQDEDFAFGHARLLRQIRAKISHISLLQVGDT
jgi:hypothetical protein